ncbi:MAG: hypothetical protein KA941_04465 [Flavobacteriales bacterium]|nr:hypothetical protein [Flavobacteriales bacterium]
MRTIFLLIALVIGATATAQGRERTFRTDSGTVVIHYFTNGKVSTKVWVDKDERWGLSIAYDATGREIFSYQTRRIAGHASADFSYHPNGAVSRIEVSDAPDGGIQWYRSTTTYDENGVKTGFTEQGRDNDEIFPGPGVRVTEKPEVTLPMKQEEVREQRMFVNEVFVVNSTRWACVVVARATNPSPGLPGGTFTVQPGDTVRLGAYSMGEVYPAPADHVSITAQRPNGKRRKRSPMEVVLLQLKQASPEHRKYFYHALPDGTRLTIAP